MFLYELLIGFGLISNALTNNEFILEDIPIVDSPQNLQVVEVKGNLVQIKFDPVSPELLMECYARYLIKIWNNRTNKTLTFLIPPTVTNTELPYFANAKNFITISISNCRTVGPPSEVVCFESPLIKPAPPKDFQVLQLNSTSVLLKWIFTDGSNDVLLGFRVNVTDVTDLFQTSCNVTTYDIMDPSSEQKKIVNLKEGARYRFSISSVNCVGESKVKYTERKMEHHSPAPPGKPNFSWKFSHDMEKIPPCHTPSLLTKLISTALESLPKEKEDNSNEHKELKSAKESEETENNNCKLSCYFFWNPNEEDNPGNYFFIKYRKQGEIDFNVTAPEYKDNYVVIPNFNGCENYEVIVTSGDGVFTTDSDVQLMPMQV